MGKCAGVAARARPELQVGFGGGAQAIRSRCLSREGTSVEESLLFLEQEKLDVCVCNAHTGARVQFENDEGWIRPDFEQCQGGLRIGW